MLVVTVYVIQNHFQNLIYFRNQWVKRWFIWRYMFSYFPINLIKTADLPADRHYILAGFPHGIFAYVYGRTNEIVSGIPFSMINNSRFPSSSYAFIYRPFHTALVYSATWCVVNRNGMSYFLTFGQNWSLSIFTC